MEGALTALIALLAVTAVAVFLARQIAIAKSRGQSFWMWAVAIFPPSVLFLSALPRRTNGAAA